MHFEFLNRQIDNGFFNRPIIAHKNKVSGAVSQTDLYNESLVSSVVQAKLLACCYGFMSEFVTSADIILFSINTRRAANNSLRNEIGVICVKNINFASRPYMYFSEQGNVDDDATFITIFLVSFNLQSCCLMQSAVCKCYTPMKQRVEQLYTVSVYIRNIQLIQCMNNYC